MSFRFTPTSSTRPTGTYAGGSKFLKGWERFFWRFRRLGQKLALLLFCVFFLKRLNQLPSHRHLSSRQTYQFFTSAFLLKRYPEYGISPVSYLRPANQFSIGATYCRNNEHLSKPVLTILTVTKNPRRIMTETANFMRSQSLCAIRWVIINDHTTDRDSFEFLELLASKDVRITLQNSSFPPGFSNGRNFAIQHLRQSPTPYFAFLDDDDMFELTAYEKFVWMLESNRNLYMAGSFIIGFGEKNYTWNQGFHDGLNVFNRRNPLSGSEILRTSVLYETPCSFDPMLKAGMEDWDFFLCLAANGKWGSTIPDYLFWYRQNPMSLRKARWSSLFEDKEETVAYIRSKHGILTSRFPRPFMKQTGSPPINMTIPFANELTVAKGVMVILSSEDVLDCHTNPVLMIRNLCRKGQRITVVNTAIKLTDMPGALRRCLLMSTHDIFDLPAMLHISDAPRFLSYLITSRSIDRVLVSQTGYTLGLVPLLAKVHGDVSFFSLTESMPVKANKLSRKIYRFFRDVAPCISWFVKLKDPIPESRPITEREVGIHPLMDLPWSPQFCDMEIFHTTRQLLRDYAKESSEYEVVYNYETVYEFLLHSIWPQV